MMDFIESEAEYQEQGVNDSWNWIVSIEFNQSKICTGTLITASWILTAASCIEPYAKLAVLVSVKTQFVFGVNQNRTVTNIILHEQFDVTNGENDIALLNISHSFNTTSPDATIICLPKTTTVEIPSIDAPVCLRIH